MNQEEEPSFHEKHFLEETRKAERLKRKFAQAKDRSKYKKTDLAKRTTAPPPKGKNLQKGTVLAILAETVRVACKDNTTRSCTLRGSLKKEKKRLKNLLIVGDIVWIDTINKEEGVIVKVEERYSVLSRSEQLKQRKKQLIAANIDQVLITVSILAPSLKPTLIDRYIIAAKRGNMESVIVVNKIDLLKNPHYSNEERTKEKKLLNEMKKGYALANIPLITTSTHTKTGLAALKTQMQGKTSVFSGQSGVGKSTLINCLFGFALKTASVVAKTKKGAHTTSTAELLPLPFGGGFCIDTPGIKSFGVWELQREEIQSYYSEIVAIKDQCRYLNCQHDKEPDCAIKDAVNEGILSPLRYHSYLQLLHQTSKKHFNR